MKQQSQTGQALIQVLISIGIVSILSLAIASVIQSLSKENRALAEKMAAIDLTRVISSALANTTACSAIFGPGLNPASAMPFDISVVSTANPHIIPIQSIPNIVTAGSVASALSNSLVVLPNQGAIVGMQLRVTNSNPPTGTLFVNFDQTRLVRALPNLIFSGIVLTAQGSSSSTTLTGCRSTSGGSGIAGGFQSFQSRAVNTDYVAATDGLILTTVMATSSSRSTYISISVNGTIMGYSGATDSMVEESLGPQSLTIPVPKDSSWRVNLTGGQTSNTTVQWVPVGNP